MQTKLRTFMGIMVVAALLLGMFSAPTPSLAQPAGGGDTPPASGSRPLAPTGTSQKNDDEHFVIDDDGDGPLDQYLFRIDLPNGRLKFNIEIGRFYFNTDYVSDFENEKHKPAIKTNGQLDSDFARRVKEKKLLPEYANLRLKVYDVDETGRPCAEQDRIIVNGQALMRDGRQEKLSGADETWSTPSYRIPIEMLRFPRNKGSDGGAPAEAVNTIEIDVDAGGCNGWAVQIDYAILEIVGPIRPIVFAHGWTGNTDAFSSVQGRMRTDGIPDGGAADLLEGIELMSKTAPKLIEQIDRAVQEYGVNKVNVFAHSKGGLVIRRALYNERTQKRVDHVVTYDSPHHGTLLAENNWAVEQWCKYVVYKNDPTRAAKCATAAREFSMDEVRKTFNFAGCTQNILGVWSNCKDAWVKADGVKYHAFTAIGDATVTPKATTAYPWDIDWNSTTRRRPYPYFTDIDTKAQYEDSHGGIISRQDSYQCAINLLNKDLYSCPGHNAAAAPQATADLEPTADQLIDVQAGSLAGAGVFDAAFPVDAGAQIILRVDGGPGLTVTATEPGGRAITPAVALADAQIDYSTGGDDSLSTYAYIINAPVAGAWQVHVAAAAADDFAISAYIDPEIALNVIVDQAAYQFGETITAQAALVQAEAAVTGGTFTGEFEQADGSFAALTFYDDGTHGDATPADGVFTTQFTAPSAQSHYSLRVYAEKGQTLRQSALSVPVSNPTAQVVDVVSEATVDEDTDGLADQLQISVRLNVLQQGHFDLFGTLVGPGGVEIQSVIQQSRSSTDAPMEPGDQYLLLSFDGKQIFESGLDGPYTLTNLRLQDTTGQIFDVDTAADLFTTQAYLHNQFEHELLWFQSATAAARDYDRNRRYDALTFDLRIGVDQAEYYYLNGRLVDPNGAEIGWSSASFNASAPGVYPVEIQFAGSLIGASKLNGPYTLADITLSNDSQTIQRSFSTLKTSAAYTFKQFELGYNFANLPLLGMGQAPALLQYPHGRITFQGRPVAGQAVNLGFWDGEAWTKLGKATSNANGEYAFANAPTPVGEQTLEAWWENTSENADWLSYWNCNDVYEGSAPEAYECNFDIEDVDLKSPANGASSGAPVTFVWDRRKNMNEMYSVYMVDVAFGSLYWEAYVGYDGGYRLGYLPSWILPNQAYHWSVFVDSSSGYGQSFSEFTLNLTGAGALQFAPPPAVRPPARRHVGPRG